MSEYLPGSIPERIGDLRSGKGWSQRRLAEWMEIAPSQLSRIESGETQHISSDILIKLADAFGVSTDFILGKTNVSTPKSYEVSKLGLSDGAVRMIVKNKAEVQMLNQLLEHKSFPRVLKLMKTYFEDTAAAGIMGRNAVIDIATMTADDFRKENPEHKAGVTKDIGLISAQKIGEHEAEIAKINSTFMAILKDIKKGIDTGEMPGMPTTADFTRQMMEQAQAIKREKGSVSAEEMAAVMMKVVGQAVPMDGEAAAQFEKLAKQVLLGDGDLRKEDTLPEDQDDIINETKDGVQAHLAEKDDKGVARAKIAVFAKQVGLNISRLTDEEILVLTKAIDKSDKVRKTRRK